MKNSIRDYIPPKSEQVLIQARVNKQLLDQVKPLMKSQHITWTGLMEACLKLFLDEVKYENKKQ